MKKQRKRLLSAALALVLAAGMTASPVSPGSGVEVFAGEIHTLSFPVTYNQTTARNMLNGLKTDEIDAAKAQAEQIKNPGEVISVQIEATPDSAITFNSEDGCELTVTYQGFTVSTGVQKFDITINALGLHTLNVMKDGGLFKTIKVYINDPSAPEKQNSLNEWRTGATTSLDEANNPTVVIEAGAREPLSYDYGLEQAAMQRAAEIAINYDHIRPDGTPASGILTELGLSASAYGENIAIGYSKADDVLEAWKEENVTKYEEQGHRRNLLSDTFKYIGIAHVIYNGTHYWVQEFSDTQSPAPATDAFNSDTTANVRADSEVSDLLLAIEVKTPPTKLSYRAGENLSLSGMNVIGKYSKTGDKSIPNSSLSVVKPEMLTAGDKVVTISYTDKGVTVSTTFTINVENDLPVTDTFIGAEGSSFVDAVNGTANPAYVLTAKVLTSSNATSSQTTQMNNIKSKVNNKYFVSSGYLDTEYLSIQFTDSTGAVKSNTGKVYDITLTLNDSVLKKYNLNIYRTTGSAVTALTKATTSKDATYKVSGKTIHIYTQYSATFGFAYINEDGKNKVKSVTFENFPTTSNSIETPIYVEVNDLCPDPGDPYRDGDEFIAWYNNSTKWVFDTKKITTNIVLKAKWKSGWGSTNSGSSGSGSTSTSTSGSSGSSGTASAATATKGTATLSSIRITSDPTKVFYKGDIFSFNGRVQAVYSDNTTKDISASSLLVTGADTSKTGQQIVTVTYKEGDKSVYTTYVISVLEKQSTTAATTTEEKKTEDTTADATAATGTASLVVAPVATMTGLKSKKTGTLTVGFRWNDAASGYQILYSTSKNFKTKSKKTIRVKKTSYTIKNLTPGTTYYVKIRSFVKQDGKTTFSKWSAKKKLKIS